MERLRAGDVQLLNIDSPNTPMHLATVEIFEPAEATLDYRALLALVGDRLAFVPRYRQRLVDVPGQLGRPVWIDDEDFDLTYHVRQSALPKPGTMEQLHDLVARIIPRPLDRLRPLWELYLIEGLEDGRVALLSKSHQTLVDGVSTIDLGQVILDTDANPRDRVPEEWEARRRPASPVLVADALIDQARHPRKTLKNLREVAVSAITSPIASAIGATRTGSESPLTAQVSQQRRYHTVRTSLEDYRAIRRFHGGTVNDVVLATITGALRIWLMTRAESVHSSRSLRTLVPMSILDKDLEPTSLGSQVIGHSLSLPIGEASPVIRLHQVAYAMKAHKDTGKAVSAIRLIGVGGFAPTTFHSLGARVAADNQGKDGHHLVVTNVPGPQFPLYAAGSRMTESYPVQPLLPNHAVAIGVTSYDGAVHYGITGDRYAVPDVDVIGQCITEALSELLETTSDSRARAPRGRTD